MEFKVINKNDYAFWDKVWELYSSSFPLAEQRKKEDHIRALENPHFFQLSAWDGNELIGILFYWDFDTYRYLEHFAINNKFRSQGFGTQFLKHLCNTEKTIILEIDPIVDELSNRRLRFYEKAGFALTPYRFKHLPYQKVIEPTELLILSYPKIITPKQYRDFVNFMNEKVIVYCEGYKSKENDC